jgi:hypothetical protein
MDSDWVLRIAIANGERPYWPDSALKDHIQPAARAADIPEQIG